MKLKLTQLLLVAVSCLLTQQSSAQTRYVDSIFAGYTLDSVIYSIPYQQQMNIYQPIGDVQAKRPLVVLAHGGSFAAGDRYSDNTITQLCVDLVHKGYVTVSIDYRLIPVSFNLLNPDSAAKEVFSAVSDGKAAIRYFYKDAQTSNTYKIDTNNIFVGGNSAGAVLFMHYAYLTDTGQLRANPDFPALVASIGDLEGNSGNAGYSTNIKGVINLAGGLNQADWLSYCGKPIVSAQGDKDSVVPYTCNTPYVYGFNVPLQLCGLGSLQQLITGNTPYSESMVFPGDQHVPWATDLAKFNRVDTMVTTFLYKEVMGLAPSTCGALPAGINTISAADISLYPLPASSVLNIRSAQWMSAITMTDETGRIVAQATAINNLSYQMSTAHLSSGVYFVRIDNAASQTSAVRKVIIE